MIRLNPFTVFIFCVAVVYFIYAPGLSGGFMFDDEMNFIKLNIFHSYEGIKSFIYYMSANETGFLKRPISTLSFLLNATNWPANPYYFKITNILIHILNGWLLYFASKAILTIANNRTQNIRLIALISSMIWLIHPFFVSTVLYANQRQAMLPLVFTLIGIIIYCHGRMMIRDNRSNAVVYLYISIFVFTPLATLSKENGILLPLLILIIEWTIIRQSNILPLKKIHKILLFYIPIAAICLALLYKLPDWYEFYGSRYFTLGERLLTQPRILFTYLYHLAVPEILTEGVYTDGFLKSVDLFRPISTILSIFFLVCLVWVLLFYKKLNPLFRFAALFYFAGHILESTFIPLELYFEHRNYLPTVFIPLFISYYLIKWAQNNKMFYMIPILIIGYLGFMTFKRSSLWGDDFALAIETSAKYPESMRASTTAAQFLENKKQYNKALTVLRRTARVNDSVNLYASYLILKCKVHKELVEKDFKELSRRIFEGKYLFWDNVFFIKFIKLLVRSDCAADKFNKALFLLNTIRNGKDYNGYKVKDAIVYGFALTYVHKDDYNNAFIELKKLIDNVKYSWQVEKVFDVLDYFIGHQKYNQAKECLDLLLPKLNGSGFIPDIYNQKLKYTFYLNKINNSIVDK